MKKIAKITMVGCIHPMRQITAKKSAKAARPIKKSARTRGKAKSKR